MPGAMRKMGVYLGLVEDDDLIDDGPEVYERPLPRDVARPIGPRHHEMAPGRTGTATLSREWSEPDDAAAATGYGPATQTGVRSAFEDGFDRQPAAAQAAPAYRITTLHPRTYNEARTIGEHFRSGTPVIMNLSEMDDADAKRLVDFAAGLTFGLRGRLERVTAKVFLLSPNNVTVTAADKARIAEGGFFNQS